MLILIGMQLSQVLNFEVESRTTEFRSLKSATRFH